MKKIDPFKMLSIMKDYYHYQVGFSSYGKNKWHCYANNRKNHFSVYANTGEQAIENVFKQVLDQHQKPKIATG